MWLSGARNKGFQPTLERTPSPEHCDWGAGPVPAILILGQHHVIDLLGGALVAGLAIWMVRDRESELPGQERSAQPAQRIASGE
jgi:hypothetical protein